MKYFKKEVKYRCVEPIKLEQAIIEQLTRVFGKFKYTIDFPETDVVNFKGGEMFLKIQADNPVELKTERHLVRQLELAWNGIDKIFKNEKLNFDMLLDTKKEKAIIKEDSLVFNIALLFWVRQDDII